MDQLYSISYERSCSLRLCLDQQDLNKAIKRNQWYARTLYDILPELAQPEYFTIKDATSGFWHILQVIQWNGELPKEIQPSLI